MTIGFISHHDCLLHTMGAYHPEQPQRLEVIEHAVSHSDLVNQLVYYQAPLVEYEQLLNAHDKDYIDYIFNISPSEGMVAVDPDVWLNPHSLTAALRAAGAVVYGVKLLMNKDVDAVFCNIRPPGHHAEHNKAMGFCIFNNVAVGVAYALKQFNLKRIAIIDFDVHHGNGTEDIFRKDERVLYCSTFQHPFYPFSGATTQSKHILNVPLPAGANGDLFRKKVEQFWLPQINQFAPEMIFFSAGFDAYYKDDMANLLLNTEDYLWITQKIKTIADTHCKGRLLSALEGGYYLNHLGACVVAHLRGLST
ncbi:histone deacetylase family protein [Legionella hackeliae]|uniref:Histone deacetylase superfamily n=1 Tax=Legionella hackeliae TaxID=449 RepID=A0A0A8UVQ4_LEGHA|nr:histone deacetylase family protein [Legionella hackeliae]KTD09813.1 Histone deacetylase-like amidohydrolase [Legionella hackeliae]CEK10859.1 Histone deacetylase superfamily [Legionella hackeliae]STX47595.1 Histone deacetylase-like amidohydrolase [Legionella hackeliae]